MKHPIGCPIWLDTTTDDMARTTAFYSSVLGWTWRELGAEFGGWQIAQVAGKDVVALGPGPQEPWQVYLHAADIAALEDQVDTTLAAGQVGDLGWLSKIRDPGGAVVGLWQPDQFDGFGAMGPEGTPVWFEVNTRDSDAVKDFFAGLFGLTANKMEGMRYFTLHSDDGRPRYGVLHMNEEWAGMEPSWMVYFAVDDVEAAAQRVRDAGGNVCYGPFDTPFGRIVICDDGHGVAFTLIKAATGT